MLTLKTRRCQVLAYASDPKNPRAARQRQGGDKAVNVRFQKAKMKVEKRDFKKEIELFVVLKTFCENTATQG